MSILEKFTKQPADRQDYDISYEAWLAALGDTAASVVVIADAGITQSSPAMLFGGLVKVWLFGGVDGQAYKVTATLTTTAGRIKQAEIVVKVKES